MLTDPYTLSAASASGLTATTWNRAAKLLGGYVLYSEAASTVALPHQLLLNSALDSSGSLTKKSTLMVKMHREFASGTSGNPDLFVGPRLIVDFTLEATDAQIRAEIARLYDFATQTVIGQMRKGNL